MLITQLTELNNNLESADNLLELQALLLPTDICCWWQLELAFHVWLICIIIQYANKLIIHNK